MKIRRAKLEDVQSISNLMRSTIRNVNSKDYSARQIKVWIGSGIIPKVKERIRDPNKIYFVIVGNEKIMGVASLHLKEKELGAFYIKHSIHKKGVGTKLLAYMERYAKNKGFKKLKLCSTVTALGFYKKKGYKTIKKQHCILLQGVRIECVLMSKKL